MENNNNMQQQYNQQNYQQAYQQQYQQNYQQTYQQQYQQPYQPYSPQYGRPIDPNYDMLAKDFLTKAIVSCAIASLPVGSFIAIAIASKNRKAVLEYLEQGGIHTERIKVCSALSRAGKYAGIGFSIFWGFYLLIYALYFALIIIGISASTR